MNIKQNNCQINGVYVCVCECSFRLVHLFATQWTVVLQAPLFMEFSRKNTKGDGHFLLQGISTMQSSSSYLLHFLNWQAASSPLHHMTANTDIMHLFVCMCVH